MVSNKRDLNNHTARVDHRFSEENNFYGRFIFYRQFTDNGLRNLLPDPLARQRLDPFGGRNIVLGDTHTITPNLVHEFRIGLARQFFTFQVASAGLGIPQQIGLPPIVPPDQLPLIGNGLPAFPDAIGTRTSQVGQLFDSFSYLRGKHSMKFGTEMRLVQANNLQKTAPSGNFQFPTTLTDNAAPIADFLLGGLDSFDQGTGEYKNNRATYPALFVQDDFKVAQRLTLNLGLRYEPTPPWHETRGRIEYFTIENFRNGVRSSQFKNAPPGVLFRGDPGVPEDGALGDYNNFGGRFGFAWDVFGDGKTSVRGGAGMFYDQHLLGEFNNGGVNAPPWSVRLSVTRPPGPFSNPYLGRNDFNLITLAAIGSPDAPFPRPVLLTTYDGKHTTPLTHNWNLTLEREIFPSWLARAAYVGSASNYGRVVKQLNPARPGTGSTDSRRLFAPELGNIDYFTEDRRSYYHSMQLTLNKRLSQGFTVLANYTWSKALGNYSGSAGEANEVAPWNVPNADSYVYGSLDFDYRHRFVVSWVWELPKAPTDNAFLKGLLHGWQANGIGQYQSGGAYTVTSGRDNSQTGINRDRAKFTGVSPDPASGSDKTVWFNPAAFAVNDVGTFGTVGRGAFHGPHLFSWDMGFFKTFAFTEQVNLQFRAEMFNIFNQVNFANPNINVSGGGFGRITTTHPNAGDPRIIQFGLKLNF